MRRGGEGASQGSDLDQHTETTVVASHMHVGWAQRHAEALR